MSRACLQVILHYKSQVAALVNLAPSLHQTLVVKLKQINVIVSKFCVKTAMNVNVDEFDSSMSTGKDFDSGDLSQSTVDRESMLCMWSHLRDFFEFDTHDKKTGKLLFQCFLCKPKKKYISASVSSNSNLRTHIKHVHPSKLDDFNKASKNTLRAVKRNLVHEKFDEQKPDSKQRKLDHLKKNKFLTKQKFDQATLKLIINTASAFSLVEHEAFIEFCEIIQQTPMTRKTLMTHIDKTFEKMKMELIEELEKVEWVCVTADCWTAFKRSYLGMTIHWLDHDTLERKSKGLACHRLEGRHTYDILARAIEMVLIEFNIQDKTTCIVTDNARNFEKAFKVYSEIEEAKTENERGEHLESVEISEILATNEESYRLPPQQKCASHTLNLVSTIDTTCAEADTNYKGISRRTFAKCQAIFNKQNQSSVAADMVKKSLGKYLKVPNATRWNSFYDAIVEVTNNIKQVNVLASSLNIPTLTPNEIDFLKEYCTVIRPVAKGLDILQGDKHIFMGYLLPTLVSIEEHLNQKLTEVFYVKPLVNALLKGIYKRFHYLYQNNDLKIAACLIPDFKLCWMQDENEKKEVTELLKSIVQMFNFKDAEVHTSILKEQTVLRKTDDFFIFHNMPGQNQNENAMTDHIIQTYLSTDTFTTEKNFPKALKRAFIKYNTSIPSSAHVERLFSAGGLVFDNLRGKMSDKNFEMALLLKFNKYL